jgi:hypothetical protein
MTRPSMTIRSSIPIHRLALIGTAFLATLAASSAARGQRNDNSNRDDHSSRHDGFFAPGNLVISRSVFENVPGLAAYPFVWNNDLVDASFGITSRIFLDQMTAEGVPVNTLEVPNSAQRGEPSRKGQLVTSFSSKSELALNLSTDGEYLTFMGYVAPIGAIDVSNSNTPAVIEPRSSTTCCISRRAAAATG